LVLTKLYCSLANHNPEFQKQGRSKVQNALVGTIVMFPDGAKQMLGMELTDNLFSQFLVP